MVTGLHRSKPIVDDTTNNNVDHGELVKILENHEERLTVVEAATSDIGEIKDIVLKIARYIKIVGPSLISAALAAGFVNGKLGAFLHALAGGVQVVP